MNESYDYFATRSRALHKVTIISLPVVVTGAPRESNDSFATRYWALKKVAIILLSTRFFPHNKWHF